LGFAPLKLYRKLDNMKEITNQINAEK